MPPIIRGNRVYKIVGGPSWAEAEANSITLGGHLTAITSKEENDFLWSRFGAANRLENQLWIGLNDAEVEGTWRWSSGEEVTYTNWAYVAPANSVGIQYAPGEGAENQDYVNFWHVTNDGTWDDYFLSGYGDQSTGIAEVPISWSMGSSSAIIEGCGPFNVSIQMHTPGGATDLIDGAEIYWDIKGITDSDLELGSIYGLGVVAGGRLDLEFALASDSTDENEDFVISLYSDSLRTAGHQIASWSSRVFDLGPIGVASSDYSKIIISGKQGAGYTSKIEAETVSRVNTNAGTGKPVWQNVSTYTLLQTFSDVEGINYSGGASANTISAAGISGDYSSRPSFNGICILDGGLGADIITGGSYRNWLRGGGIFDTPQSTTTTEVDKLIGTLGALDVFDLRSPSNLSTDAYSAINSGSATITNYSRLEDQIVVSGLLTSYTFAPQTQKSGKGKNSTTAVNGYQIFSGTKLIASIGFASGETVTGNWETDLNIRREDSSVLPFFVQQS